MNRPLGAAKASMPKTTTTPEVRINTQNAAQPQDPASSAQLPHERDQSIAMTDGARSPDMEQAHKDLQRGLRDTDARGADGRPLPPPPTGTRRKDPTR